MNKWVLLLSLSALLGCSRLPTPLDQYAETKPVVHNEESEPLRYLALGDSYTAGEMVQRLDHWPNQLADLLRDAGYAVETPQIVARSGWTTGELAAGLLHAELHPPYGLVSVLIGANNQFLGYSPESFRRELAALLEQAVAFAGNRPDRVLVLSLPDWSVTPVGMLYDRDLIAGEIDAYNAVILQEAMRRGVHHIDITPISRLAESDPELVSPDGLHPSGKMYAQWAALVLREAVLALEE